MNKAAFDKLDPATQKVVLAEAAKAEALGWAEAEKLSAGFLEDARQERDEGGSRPRQARPANTRSWQEAHGRMARKGRPGRQSRGRRPTTRTRPSAPVRSALKTLYE